MSGGKQPLRRTIRGGRPFFFSDPAIDKVLNMVVTLGSEVWALRERLAAVEGIQERQGALAPGEVDGYEFTPEQEQKLAADRKEFIENLFRVLQEQVDAAREKAAREARAIAKAPTSVAFGARGARATPPRATRKPAKTPARTSAKAPAKPAAGRRRK
jgi:hypothetical protein